MSSPETEVAEESERRFRCSAEALPHIVWSASADGRLDFCNERWFHYTGLGVEDSLRSGWQTVVHSEDLANLSDVWIQSVKAGVPYEIECRLRRGTDGTYRWHFVRALPYRDAAGSVVKWFGSCTDVDDHKRVAETIDRFGEQLLLNEREISARKRAEAALRASRELYRQVEDHAPLGLALVALGGSFIRVNPALCALTGYNKDELLSTRLEQLTRPGDGDGDGDSAYAADLLAASVTNRELETRFIRKDGQSVWCLLTVSVVRDEGGEALYYIAQVQDIGARKLAEQAVKAAEKAALSSIEAKSRFLATMSHEIRTPMNGIIGMLEFLSLSALDAEQTECLKIVRESSDSLLRVLNDVLDFSKIEAGKLSLESVDFDLSSQLNSVVSLLGPQATAKRVAVTARIDDAVAATLKGDPGRVRQILINLVGNAIKFTPPGGTVGIDVACARATAQASDVRFTIVDSGAGIPADVRGRLFLPFSQLDDSTTRKFGGTGLGLAICKQIVELMGGEIGFESTPGSGSSFWFTCPFLPATGSAIVPEERPANVVERRATVRPRSERLLLAEDNEINAMLAIKQFKRLGFTVTLVPNGREAVEAVERERFDIVFMDCHMPVMDGFEATRRIRDLTSREAAHIPIVAMTAYAQAGDRTECLAAGMDDYVSKPSTLSDLHLMLERWLPGHILRAAERPAGNVEGS